MKLLTFDMKICIQKSKCSHKTCEKIVLLNLKNIFKFPFSSRIYWYGEITFLHNTLFLSHIKFRLAHQVISNSYPHSSQIHFLQNQSLFQDNVNYHMKQQPSHPLSHSRISFHILFVIYHTQSVFQAYSANATCCVL